MNVRLIGSTVALIKGGGMIAGMAALRATERQERREKEALRKAEERFLARLNRLSRPAPLPAPYRAPGRPTTFFTSGWKPVTAEMIEAMAENEEVNDLVLGLVTLDPLEEVVLRHDVTPPPVRRPKFRRLTGVRQTDSKRTYKGRKYERHLAA